MKFRMMIAIFGLSLLSWIDKSHAENTECAESGKCTCKVGFYGGNCTLACPESCHDVKCSMIGGECFSCKDGYFSTLCEKPCLGHCVGSCDQKSGYCLACQEGYYGTECMTSCPDQCVAGCERHDGMCTECHRGFYGETCQLSCPPHCGNRRCNKKSGNCHWCEYGRYGAKCELIPDFNTTKKNKEGHFKPMHDTDKDVQGPAEEDKVPSRDRREVSSDEKPDPDIINRDSHFEPEGDSELNTPEGDYDLDTPEGDYDLDTPDSNYDLLTSEGDYDLETPDGSYDLDRPDGEKHPKMIPNKTSKARFFGGLIRDVIGGVANEVVKPVRQLIQKPVFQPRPPRWGPHKRKPSRWQSNKNKNRKRKSKKNKNRKRKSKKNKNRKRKGKKNKNRNRNRNNRKPKKRRRRSKKRSKEHDQDLFNTFSNNDTVHAAFSVENYKSSDEVQSGLPGGVKGKASFIYIGGALGILCVVIAIIVAIFVKNRKKSEKKDEEFMEAMDD